MNGETRNKLIGFGIVVLLALVLLFPTIKKVSDSLNNTTSEKKEWISKPISLGLDLSGGVQILYEVQKQEAVVNHLQVIANTIKSNLKEQKIPVLKARAASASELEIILLSEVSIEKAKKAIEEMKEKVVVKNSGMLDSQPKIILGVTDLEAKEIERNAVLQAVETLRNRVDAFGVAEPIIQRVGEDRILLQMPGIQDINSVKNIVGKVAKLEFRLVPDGSGKTGVVTLKNKDKTPIQVEDLVQLTGGAIKDASVGFDPNGQIEVHLNLNADGAKTFAKVTGENINRQLAIVLDGEVYSAPRINDRITGGNCVITGIDSIEEANQLKIVLKAGALPASLKVLEESTVGPSLGKESIKKGITAILVGCLAVFVFMLVYYKKSGLVAIIALLTNVLLVLAGLSMFGATLTLPGLAGIGLTVGMAVDANVLIFERIRDELRKGVGKDVAITEGFAKALSAIVDSNLTSLFAALILYWLGTGPIRGFAVTLSIGILTTIFCATFVSKVMFELLNSNNKDLSI